MSATDSETARNDYFEAIETAFISLRGAPLLLSPADWQTARSWHEQGVPLEVVLEVVRSVFARREERGSKRKISSLAYCAPAVEEAWSEIVELGAAAGRLEPAPVDVPERLARLQAAIPEALPLSDEISGSLQGLAGGAEEVERSLQELDRHMLQLAEADLDPPVLAEISAHARKALARSRRGMETGEAAEVEARLYREFLRRRLDLPTLSLFSTLPEIEPAAEDESG
jgi:hypothetical protein